jgi:hypothetical protein
VVQALYGAAMEINKIQTDGKEVEEEAKNE